MRKLRDLIDWDRFTDRFVAMWACKAEHGRPPYHPVLVFKCLLLAYLYNLSERSVEWFCHSTFEGRLFLDVGLSDPTLDQSTLSRFRSRIEAATEPDGPESKDANKERLLKLQADPRYQERLSQRYTIEAKFGEAKAWRGFG